MVLLITFCFVWKFILCMFTTLFTWRYILSRLEISGSTMSLYIKHKSISNKKSCCSLCTPSYDFFNPDIELYHIKSYLLFWVNCNITKISYSKTEQWCRRKKVGWEKPFSLYMHYSHTAAPAAGAKNALQIFIVVQKKKKDERLERWF